MVKDNIEETLAKLRELNLENPIREFLDEDPSETHQLLVEFVSSQRGNIDAERRDEDSEWFEGKWPTSSISLPVFGWRGKGIGQRRKGSSYDSFPQLYHISIQIPNNTTVDDIFSLQIFLHLCILCCNKTGTEPRG